MIKLLYNPNQEMISFIRLIPFIFFFFHCAAPNDYFGNSETSEVRIFKVKDIPWPDIAFSSVKFLLEKYKYDLNNKKQFGFYSNS